MTRHSSSVTGFIEKCLTGVEPMPSAKQKLSVPTVRAAAPRDRRYVIRDSETPLRLMVTPNGHKSYQVLKRIGAKVQVVTLGDADVMTLAVARKKATSTMAELASGRDLNAEKKSRRRAATLGQAFSIYRDAHLAGRGARYRQETIRLFGRDVLPKLGDEKLADIDRGVALSLLETKAKTAPATAALLQRTLRAFFSWCVDRGHADSNPLASTRAVVSVPARERVLSVAELRVILSVAEPLQPRIRSLLLALVLTAQRAREVSGMRWKDLDFNKGVWVLPASSAKNGLALTIPLPALLMAELAKLPKAGDFVFGAAKPADPWSNLKSGLDRRLRDAGHEFEPWVFHDIRRSCASLLAENGVPVEIADRLLNHKASATFSGVLKVYQRYEFLEERRGALDLWANLVLGHSAAQASH